MDMFSPKSKLHYMQLHMCLWLFRVEYEQFLRLTGNYFTFVFKSDFFSPDEGGIYKYFFETIIFHVSC